MPDDKGQPLAKFATMNLYENGRIDLKCNWEERKQGTLRDVYELLRKLHEIITRINLLEYHLPGVDRNRRIPLPKTDVDFLDTSSQTTSNTQLVLINTINHLQQTDGTSKGR